MKMECEKCGSKMLLKSKTKQKSGRTYYRFRCKNQQCLHRTSAYTGKITHPNHLATGGLKNASTKRALNEAQVLRVLLETRLGTTALAKELGCNQRTVRDIKLGKAYKTFTLMSQGQASQPMGTFMAVVMTASIGLMVIAAWIFQKPFAEALHRFAPATCKPRPTSFLMHSAFWFSNHNGNTDS